MAEICKHQLWVKSDAYKKMSVHALISFKHSHLLIVFFFVCKQNVALSGQYSAGDN